MQGWQWVFVVEGLPAVALGLVVLLALPDRPRDAGWLSADEREALEGQLEIERARRAAGHRMTLLQAFGNPRVLLLAFAYLCSTSANYGVEFFLPSILQQWYSLNIDRITWLVILPPILALASQIAVGWNSDRTRERRLHAVVPITLGMAGLALVPLTRGNLPLTIAVFMLIVAGIKAYQPAFWSLPSLFLTDVAAAGSIGLINSIGNLGGFFGPTVLGGVENLTGSFVGGIYYLAASMGVCAVIIFTLGVGRRERGDSPA
jgi:ACS family tartrate transporter-like MFS transporter